MQKTIQHLFVYGTLTKNNIAHSKLFSHKIEYLGKAKTHGRLYDLGDYPGLVSDDTKFVYGEIYTLNDLSSLAELDNYEGITLSEKHSLYRREVINAELDSGCTVDAFVYVYNQSLSGATEIPSGIWIKK